jgi:hypothetical protein
VTVPSPLSIFSFDTLQIRWGVPRGLLTAVILLGVLDFGLSRADWPYRKYPSSYVGTFLAQEEVLRSDPVPPRIIILGNSRSKGGLLSREMEHLLGLPKDTVLNLSIESGDLYDNCILQQRNRQRMKSARLLICCVDAYQWNANFPLSERFNHFASLTDRLNLDPSVPSLFGWFFRTEEKAALYHAIFRRIQARVVSTLRPIAEKEPRGAPGNQPTAPLALGPVEDPVAYWYGHFKLSPERLSLLQKIVHAAQEDGQQVLVVQLPVRDEWLREVRRTHSADYDEYKATIHSLDGVSVALFDDASSCGLLAADFQDWEHLNPTGAARFTQLWCDWLTNHERDTLTAIGASAR